MSTAILVDTAFFLKRFRHVYPDLNAKNPTIFATTLCKMCMAHVGNADLYRILAYDCPALNKRTHHPITQELVDFLKLPGALFRLEFHKQLKQKRKVALRLGYLRVQN